MELNLVGGPSHGVPQGLVSGTGRRENLQPLKNFKQPPPRFHIKLVCGFLLKNNILYNEEIIFHGDAKVLNQYHLLLTTGYYICHPTANKGIKFLEGRYLIFWTQKTPRRYSVGEQGGFFFHNSVNFFKNKVLL